MAELVAAAFMSHTPFCFRPVEDWEGARSRRRYRDDVPFETREEMVKKKERIQAVFANVKDRLAAAEPDVLIIFGDDQLECFDMTNFPSIGIYVGPSFIGSTKPARVLTSGKANEEHQMTDKVASDQPFATAILSGLVDRDFDPAFSMDLPRPDMGMSHSVMLPLGALTDLQIPTVPVLLNCYYAPQITARRARQIGLAIRSIIDSEERQLRVAVIGSGGLWHTPGMDATYLDEEFDQLMLAHLKKGDSAAMARDFDTYQPATADLSQVTSSRIPMPLPRGETGPQGGTREICNWIAAAAVSDGQPAEVVDYIPLYASPIGVGIACWTKNQ